MEEEIFFFHLKGIYVIVPWRVFTVPTWMLDFDGIHVGKYGMTLQIGVRGIGEDFPLEIYVNLTIKSRQQKNKH